MNAASAPTRQLVQDLATLTDKINVEVYDFQADADKAKAMGIDKIPALAIIGRKDHGVRIYGIPYGYELQTLLEALVTVSTGKTDLSEKTKAILADIKSPVHIQGVRKFNLSALFCQRGHSP